MAKQQTPIPMPKAGGVLPKIIGAVVVIAVLTMVIKQPVQAAELTKEGFAMLGTAAEGVRTFLTAMMG